MKAITLFIALALFALAAANDHTADTISAPYAWWTNLSKASSYIGIYFACFFRGQVSAFIGNDGGSGFYSCIMDSYAFPGVFTTVAGGDVVFPYNYM